MENKRETKRSMPTRRLLIDLDLVVDDDWLAQYRGMIRMVLKSFGLTPTTTRITPSRRKGYHVRIYLSEPISASQAVMLQWLLLDDHGRVDFNRARVNARYDEWNKLFEPPRRRFPA